MSRRIRTDRADAAVTTVASDGVSVPAADPLFTAPAQRALFDLWCARCRGRAMPRRADFDTLELLPWMGDLHVVDVEDGGRQFRFRVFATNHARRLGYDLTARTTEAFPAPLGDQARILMTRATAEGQPFLARKAFLAVNEFRPISRLLLPLADAGGGAERMFIHIHVGPLSEQRIPGRIWKLHGDGSAEELSVEA